MNDHPAAHAVTRFLTAWGNQDWDSMKDLLLDDDSQEIDSSIERLKSSVVRCEFVRILDLQNGGDGRATVKLEVAVTDLASVTVACICMARSRLVLLANGKEGLAFQQLRRALSPGKIGLRSSIRREELILVTEGNDGYWRVDVRNKDIPLLKYADIGGRLGETTEDARSHTHKPGHGTSFQEEETNMILGLSLEITMMGKILGMSEAEIDNSVKQGATIFQKSWHDILSTIIKEPLGTKLYKRDLNKPSEEDEIHCKLYWAEEVSLKGYNTDQIKGVLSRSLTFADAVRAKY